MLSWMMHCALFHQLLSATTFVNVPPPPCFPCSIPPSSMPPLLHHPNPLSPSPTLPRLPPLPSCIAPQPQPVSTASIPTPAALKLLRAIQDPMLSGLPLAESPTSPLPRVLDTIPPCLPRSAREDHPCFMHHPFKRQKKHVALRAGRPEEPKDDNDVPVKPNLSSPMTNSTTSTTACPALHRGPPSSATRLLNFLKSPR